MKKYKIIIYCKILLYLNMAVNLSTSIIISFSLLTTYFNSFCCTKKSHTIENILNIEGYKNQKEINIKYSNYNKENIFENIKDENIIQPISSLYYDTITKKENEKTIDDNISLTLKNIKNNIISILYINENFNNTFKDHIENIFKKINKFKENMVLYEGIKDKILLLIMLKKIDIILKNAKKNIQSDRTISANGITLYITIPRIIKEFENTKYTIKQENNNSFTFSPSFTDNSLIQCTSNIIAYIKACFIIYSIYIGIEIHNAFPMLFRSKMKIEELDNVKAKKRPSLFDNRNSDKNATDLLIILESDNSNSNIAYLYREILVSPLSLNKKIVESISSNKKNNIFFKSSIGSFTYNIDLNDKDATKGYKTIYGDITEAKRNTLTKMIKNIFEKTITKIDNKKLNLIYLLKNDEQQRTKYDNIIFQEYSTKYIDAKDIIFLYKKKEDNYLETVKYKENTNLENSNN